MNMLVRGLTPIAATAYERHRAFHRKIEAKAAALHPPPRPAPTWDNVAPPPEPISILPATAWFKECWFLIESVSPCRTLSMMQIKQAVCDHYGVSMGDLVSARRTKDIILPRQVAVYLCRELTPSSLPAIGHAFGSRDHTTMIHCVRKIRQLLSDTPKLAASIAEIRSGLEGLL